MTASAIHVPVAPCDPSSAGLRQPGISGISGISGPADRGSVEAQRTIVTHTGGVCSKDMYDRNAPGNYVQLGVPGSGERDPGDAGRWDLSGKIVPFPTRNPAPMKDVGAVGTVGMSVAVPLQRSVGGTRGGLSVGSGGG